MAEYLAASEDDPLIEQAIEHWAAIPDEVERARHLDFAAYLVAERAPSLPSAEWRTLLEAVLTGREMRTTMIPGIAGHPVWAIRDDVDADALRDAIEPGQVWVRADPLMSDEWPTVRAVARMVTVRDLGKAARVGRKPGSTNRGRDALLDAINANPSMSDDELDGLGVDLAGWITSEGDYDLRRKRVKRAREDAEKRGKSRP